MSGKHELIRREIKNSGSPLARHSINQKKTNLESQGEERLSGMSHRSKKELRAEARRKNMQERAIVPEGTIVFAEDRTT